MIWTKFFDGIYLINLPHRTRRFMDAAEELESYGIPFETVHAISDSKPEKGLWETMRILMHRCCWTSHKRRILVFEDDLHFVENPNNYMPEVIRQLDGKKWDMLSLGPNTHELLQRAAPNLLLMKKCRALHAMAYNFGAIQTISDRSIDNLHLDQFLEDFLQPKGNCYCTYPLLCTQKNGPSDISDETDKSYIVKRFAANTIHLQTEN